MKRAQWCGALLLIVICCTGITAAQDDGGEYYALLFSSNGCGSCGDTDMFVFTELVASYPELVVVDYELSSHQENAAVYGEISTLYGARKSVPTVILGDDLIFIGKTAILNNISPLLDARRDGTLANAGSLLSFETLSLSSPEGYPKIWRANRVLIFEEEGADNAFLKDLMNTPDINGTLAGHEYEVITPPSIQVGKQTITFEHAVRVDGWVLQWNDADEPVEGDSSVATPLSVCGALCAFAIIARSIRKE